MQPSVIQRAVVRRTIRASTTRHWLQTRQPIITQSQLRYLSTESASEHNSNGFNSEKRNPETESSNNQYRKSRNDYSSHDEPFNAKTKMLDAALTAFASIVVLGTGFALGGYLYHRIHRAEQEKIDKIVHGEDRGHYHLLIGEKGVGKSSMLLEAMQKIDGEGVSMFEAHADPEIFRVRLGKALNFEFNEDYIGSYFSERGPRDSTALLDIERAMNKLEKVALKRRSTGRGPLIVIINAIHLLRDDENGKDLLELLQQRAEQWAASNLVTMVFNSDDYWVYERLKLLATRMEVTTIPDLPRSLAVSALQRYRQKYYAETPSSEILNEVYNRVGGRLTFLNRVAKSSDMLETCNNIIDTERRWFLNQCWILGMEMDDDVMDQQKYASAAMVLAQALVAAEKDTPTYIDDGSHNIPEIPLHKARQIMTRADFIQQYDHVNLFTITSKAMVRADSVPMQQAFRSICAEEGFQKHLEATLQRINDIESLGRTREIVAKDLVLGGKYKITMSDGEKRGTKVTEVVLETPEEEDDDDGGDS
ncbi:hypothetical protein H4I95_03701 [Botrytis cinerea]